MEDQQSWDWEVTEAVRTCRKLFIGVRQRLAINYSASHRLIFEINCKVLQVTFIYKLQHYGSPVKHLKID